VDNFLEWIINIPLSEAAIVQTVRIIFS